MVDDAGHPTEASEDAIARAFLRDYEAFHRNLREQDPVSWAALERERREFDGTLMDGLHEE